MDPSEPFCSGASTHILVHLANQLKSAGLDHLITLLRNSS